MTAVACQQLAPAIGDLDGNIELSVGAVASAVAAGADVVVLPELVTSGYVFRDAAEAESVAITPDHPVFRQWQEAAGNAVVIGGFCESGSAGALYNSAAVVDRTGVIAVYRKLHLWDDEQLVFTPGDAPPPVVTTVAGRIGVLICYDLEFPEMPRALALDGAELIAVPTNWPLVPRPDGERPPEVVMAMGAARASQVFVACCDRTGTERGQEWTAGTTIVDTAGWPVATASGISMAVADLDLSRARDKAIGPRNDVVQDRRPDLYARLLRP